MPGSPSRLDRLAQLLPQMLADLERLVTLESPSASHEAVRASAAVVAAQGERALGMPPEWIVVDGYTHLRWRLGQGPRKMLVLGHHDTVWPIGTLERLPWSVEAGVVRGPGCFDMLAGVVQGFYALAALRSEGHDLDGVSVLITGDEEIGSPSSRALIEAEAAGCDVAFVLEASADGGALKTGRKGVSLYTVKVSGRAAHAGLEPQKGTSAAIEVAHQVLAVTRLSDPAAGTTVTPTVMSAGATHNTVPAHGQFCVDVRVLTTDEQERVDEAMQTLTPVLDGARVEVLGGPNRPPLEASFSASILEFANEVASGLGLPPLVGVTVGGASDGNFTAGLGIPTLDGLGAVGGGAHADDEHVIVAAMPERTAILAGLVEGALTGRAITTAPYRSSQRNSIP